MTIRIYKKITPILLSIVFLMAGFGFFIRTADADTVTDLATILNISPSSIPSDVSEIPQDLRQHQIDTIISNIGKDPAVVGSIRGVQNAENALAKAQNDCARIPIIGCIVDVIPSLLSNEAKALIAAEETLSVAKDELSVVIIRARESQNPLIEQFQAKNQLEDELVNPRVDALTKKQVEAEKTVADLADADIGSASPTGGATREQIEASVLAQKNASAWNTDDTIALKMQEDCSVLTGVLMPCFAEAVYKIIYKPTAYALMGAGYIFDEILTLSIEGAMVAPPFIDSTWKVVRDFSNMIFIFILLYAGVETILGGKNWMKTIRLVIIIALLINFSLFFTKVVIDAGNVLAVGVKSAISTTSVSEGLAAAFQPQQFLSAATKGPDTSGGDAIIVFLVAAVVSGFAAYIFFKAALLFMGRLIAFWGLMIISPFAFVSMAMPKGNIFNDWLDMLLKQSFVAPVFLFFVYIIMKVISSGTGLLDNFTHTQGDWFKELLGPVIVATLLIIALKQALDIATKMSDKMGKLGSDMTSTAMGLAAVAPTMAGAATGGLIRGVGAATSWTAKKAGATGGKFDKFGQGIQSTGKFVGSASTYIDPYKLPKHLSKIPVVGGVAGGAAKAVGGALGVSDVRNVLKGGEKGKEEAKAKKKTEENEATLRKFVDELHLDSSQQQLHSAAGVALSDVTGKKFDDQKVKNAITEKRDALEHAVVTATVALDTVKRNSPNDAVANATAIVNKRKAERDFTEFTQALSKAKDIHKDLNE